MVDNTLLIGGGIVAAGIFYFMSQGKGEDSTLEDTQATSYVGVSGDGTADNRTVEILGTGDFLEECSPTSTGDETGDSTESQCLTPLWKANESIVLEHPLAATNSQYEKYYFTVSILTDMTTSMTEDAFNALPEGQLIGDYTIDVERSGAWQENSRWTLNQNATESHGAITKSNAMDAANSVALTWNQCLTAFGGYMPGKVAATGDDIILRQGYFDDAGQFRYEKQGADGNAYPVTLDKFGLDMSGNVIPLYAQLQWKCAIGDSWTNSGGAIQVTSANILDMVGDNADGSICHIPCFPATLPTSGVALGCTLPSVSISYPSKINVYCDERASSGQDCSNVPTSAGGLTYTEWWNLTGLNTPTSMQKGGWNTPSGAVWSKVFNAWGVPRVFSDAQGWYVYASSSNDTKHYLNSVLPGFKAAYTRQTKTCTCPTDTNNAGTTFTITDKSSCPGEGSILEGDDEWKTTYCGGLAPVVGCIDSRATNYCPTCIDSTPANDPCALPASNLCTYPFGTVLSECQGGGGLGGGGVGDFGGGGTVGEAPTDDDTDESPPSGGGGTGLPGGFNPPSGGGGFGGGLWGAENILKPHNVIHTSHSFINW